MPAPIVALLQLDVGPWAFARWAGSAALIAAVTWIMVARPRNRLWIDHAIGWWLWHWFTGGPLETGRAFPCPEQQRAQCVTRRALMGAGRSTATAAVVLAEYVRSGAPSGTDPAALIQWGYGGAVAAALAAVGLAWLTCQSAIYLWWVRPLHKAVFKIAGWEHRGRPIRPGWRYIAVPRARQFGRLGVRIRVAPTFDFTDRNKEHVVETVRTKLDLGDVDHQWRLAGRRSSVTFRPAKRLPEVVPFRDADVRALMEESKPSTVLFGLGRDGTPVSRDLDTDSPHVLFSASTGGGKSSIIRSIAAQLAWHGAELWIIDFKRHSQPWARGLPGVRYARDLEEINRLLVDLGRKAEARNKACDDLPIGERPAFTRRVLICEELNGTMTLLTQWWRETRSRNDPPTCPGVTALRNVLFMGRAVQIHVLGVAQQATARALGGGEARENFAVRILAEYSANTWKMLVPQCEYVPALEHKGWAMVCYGRQAIETQLVWITEHQAHRWLTNQHQQRSQLATHQPLAAHQPAPPNAPSPAAGARGAEPPQPPAPHRLEVTGVTNPHDQGNGAVTVTAITQPADDPVRLISLREAVDWSVVSTTLAGLRQARSRDPEFPPAVKKRAGRNGDDLYWDEGLRRWERNRVRAPRNGQRHDPLVYFICVGGRPVWNDQVKIGTTTNLEDRLAAFALARTDVIKTVPGGRDVERELHARFHWERIPPAPGQRWREWFYIRGALAEYLGVHQEVTV